MLVQGGKIVAAAQEERFTRKKHDADFPRHAAEFWGPEGHDFAAKTVRARIYAPR